MAFIIPPCPQCSGRLVRSLVVDCAECERCGITLDGFSLRQLAERAKEPSRLAKIEALNADLQAGKIKIPEWSSYSDGFDMAALNRKATERNIGRALDEFRDQEAGRFPATRASKLDAVIYAAQIGAITAEHARELMESPTIETPWMRADGPPPDPLDVKYDGVALRNLLADDHSNRNEWSPQRMTPAQRAAVSAHWSAELRARVDASKERDCTRITITNDED